MSSGREKAKGVEHQILPPIGMEREKPHVRNSVFLYEMNVL